MSQREIIHKINQYWQENDIFQKTLDQRSELFQSSTYDGPPFASGTPHFGHWLASTMKDAVLRYKTMKWYKVNRERGRDCHGLPVEKAVERELWIDGKKDIEEKIWIEKFIEECRKYVSSTSDEWITFVDSLGRWADMDHAYYTMDLSFMESVIWAFKKMYNQNLVYKWFNVQRYCPSCATSLSNSEVNDWYQDKQDPAITVKFQIQDEINSDFESTEDWFIQVVDCAIQKDGKFFMLYHQKAQKYVFPGGKVEKWDNIEQTVIKELKEEIWIDVKSINLIGSFKEILSFGLFNLNMIDVEYEWEPQNIEKEKHSHIAWAEIIESENPLWFAVKIDGTIIDDADEIMNQFYDLYIYHKQIANQISDLQWQEKSIVSALAWTTTPWTLPGNSFLAVGKDLEYSMVFDKHSKEYFIIATALLKQYYKSEDEYLLLRKFKWESIVWTKYQAILPYIQEFLPEKYKKEFCKIILWDFVSTEDGTGIVHIAPSFGAEDFEAVANFLPREDSKNRLFLPVDEYWEFTEQVAEYQWMRVYDANKDIIDRLKSEWKLIMQKSYNHSYPHCRRCDTPLISKALTSRFIKEPELAKTTVPNAEKIGFVPETIKNRFSGVLSTAPDWNLARNRYWGSPIPVWENQNNEEDRIVIGTLDELYQHTLTGSKNITKNIFLRHAETDYNFEKKCDSFGKPILSELWEKQAKEVTTKLEKHIQNKENLIFVLSPLKRTLLTIKETLKTIYSPQELEQIQENYYKQIEHYQELWNDNKIIDYIQNKNQTLFDCWNNIYIDYRITDHISPDIQDKCCSCDTLNWKELDKSVSQNGETLQMIMSRTNDSVKEINQKFPTKTIIFVAHNDTLAMCRNAFVKKDYGIRRNQLKLKNAEFAIHYRDNSYSQQVDLHKPYIDNYWFEIDGKRYNRITEVMDCRFESGAMPFGQANYLGDESYTTHWEKEFLYPADFIIEWLDQTRWRFRTMHVVWNAIMWKNSFDNVIINGMVLAEDGKKMSKKLKNYPEPQELFAKYWSDSYRMYLLSSPAVKAEPVKFSEKWVEQTYKDFTSALSNAYKFFETYAKVDNFAFDAPNLYIMRHAKAESWDDWELNSEWIAEMKQKSFIEKILRINPDIMIISSLKRSKQTANEISEIMTKYRWKSVEIIEDNRLSNEWILDLYNEIKEQNWGKNVLMISHEPQIEKLWNFVYSENNKGEIKHLDIITISAYQITNELDKWILAALHEATKEMEEAMDWYNLDIWAKTVLGFIDKLNNWYIRRSRRRFWASGMDSDKHAAYMTLYSVLVNYLKLAASFAPFISEEIFLKLQEFIKYKESESIHLTHLPLWSELYINKSLLDEITKLRRIISLGLFIRAKNRIAIKQALQKIELQID